MLKDDKSIHTNAYNIELGYFLNYDELLYYLAFKKPAISASSVRKTGWLFSRNYVGWTTLVSLLVL